MLEQHSMKALRDQTAILPGASGGLGECPACAMRPEIGWQSRVVSRRGGWLTPRATEENS